MNKTTTILPAAIALFTLTASVGVAGSIQCTVTTVTDNVVTLDCGKKSTKLKVGDRVKVKTAAKKAIEGC